MTSEVVKYAPKEVIDALDNWQEITDTQLIYQLMEDIDIERLGLVEVNDWIYVYEECSLLWLQRELAVINHVFGNERLQPEREPRYIAINVPYTAHGTRLTYAKYVNGARSSINSYFQNEQAKDFVYENGMSLSLVESIIAEFGGGEIKEV